MTEVDKPKLIFFGGQSGLIPLSNGYASALQKIEVAFLLIALRRFPSALSEVVAAIESLLHSSGDSRLASRARLAGKFSDCVKMYPALQSFSASELRELRETRNTFEHKGFSPRDDSASVALILRVALPFFESCCKEIHGFDFNSNLPTEIVALLELSRRAMEHSATDTDLSFCFDAFGHRLKLDYAEIFSVTFEFASHFENTEDHYELVEKRTKELKNLFHPEWLFKCPICSHLDGAVCKLDGDLLEERLIKIEKMMCANCEYVAIGPAEILANLLLQEQIAEQAEQVFREYGIK